MSKRSLGTGEFLEGAPVPICSHERPIEPPRNPWAPAMTAILLERRTVAAADITDREFTPSNPWSRVTSDASGKGRRTGDGALPGTPLRSGTQEREKKRVKTSSADDGEANIKAVNTTSVSSTPSSSRPREAATPQSTRSSAQSSQTQPPKPSEAAASVSTQSRASRSGPDAPSEANEKSKPVQNARSSHPAQIDGASETLLKSKPPSVVTTLSNVAQEKGQTNQLVRPSPRAGDVPSHGSSTPVAAVTASTSSQRVASVTQDVGIPASQPLPPANNESPVISRVSERPAQSTASIKREEEAHAQRTSLEAETQSLMEKYERVMAEQKRLKERLETRITSEEKRNEQLKKLLDEV